MNGISESDFLHPLQLLTYMRVRIAYSFTDGGICSLISFHVTHENACTTLMPTSSSATSEASLRKKVLENLELLVQLLRRLRLLPPWSPRAGPCGATAGLRPNRANTTLSGDISE